MTFRARLAVAASVAVAAAVVLASGVAYVVVRGQLRASIDDALADRTRTIRYRPGITMQGFPVIVPQAPIGEAAGYVQVLSVDGTIALAPGESTPLPVSRAALQVAAGRTPQLFEDSSVEGAPVRILTTRIAPGVAVQVARSLAEVDSSLRRLGLILAALGAGGIGLAAGLGWLVARTSMAPVRRLTEATEHVIATGDLSERIEGRGSDEISRLAASFNSMLEVLERSVMTQRQLVADASHELRTPLASIRTNIEVLSRGEALEAGERRQLIHDVIGQLEELSVLVADLVELARGSEPAALVEEVRLDEVVVRSVSVAQRHAPAIRFRCDIEPTVVRGIPSRLQRAVGNLLDNAVKWSPPGGEIEVVLSAGELTVRDHGPGIEPGDLPHIFDRFYRSPSARGLPGSGLGLAIVRQVAESHGGRVSAEAAEGGGAVFRLRLPAQSPAEVPSLPPPPG